MDNQESRSLLEGSALINDVLNEAAEVRDEQREEHSQPQPSQPSGHSDYYTRLIAEKRKEMKTLAEKLAKHDVSYRKKDANGNEYMDFPEQVADNARLIVLKQEIDDYREEAARRSQTAAQRFEQAKSMAVSFARQQAPRVPEKIRERVTEKFVELFNGLSEQGIWERARYANQANMTADIKQLWESAIGRVSAEGWSSGGNPAPAGLDPQEEPEKAPQPQEDPFTNNLMYAYEQRKGRSMTFAEAKRAKAEAEAAARQARQEGGR